MLHITTVLNDKHRETILTLMISDRPRNVASMPSDTVEPQHNGTLVLLHRTARCTTEGGSSGNNAGDNEGCGTEHDRTKEGTEHTRAGT
jgi:hypothetical protein